MTLVRQAETVLLTDQVYMALYEAILNGQLPAGTRLKVRDLAEQVGTSVMPVRDAITRLEEAGLAERKPHKGAVVTDLTFAELTNIYEVRRILEREASSLGVANLTSADCDRMELELKDMTNAINNRDIVSYLNSDEAFLEIIYNAAGNPVLVSQIKSLWVRCRSYKIVGARRSFDLDQRETLWQHQENLLAIARKNDSAKAGKITEKSLQEASDRIKITLASKNSN
ncbi:MAG: hypothetical protein RLZZ258_1216 [Actinomycetota bacterium]|jgi:DNA-binding GntR family transcriptional regulator